LTDFDALFSITMTSRLERALLVSEALQVGHERDELGFGIELDIAS
jgi:hypothetical protein